MKNKRIIFGFIAGIGFAFCLFSMISYINMKHSPKNEPEPTPSPPTSTVLIDRIFRELQWAKIVFNTPKIIQYEEPDIVNLLLSPTKSIQQLQSELDTQQEVVTTKVKISNRMKANLTGQGFKIQALVPEVQAIRSDSTTEWKWEVMPIKEGIQYLYLTISAIVTMVGQDTPIVIQTYSKEIEVNVSIGQRVLILFDFLGSNWEWTWAAILVPLATFFWHRYRKKKSENSPNNHAKVD